MKYIYQLLLYIVIFFAGYSSNFLIPINVLSAQSGKITGSDNVVSCSNTQPDKNNYINVENDNKKIPDARSRAGSSDAISSFGITSDSQSSSRSESSAALHNELAKLRDYRMQTEINKHNEYLQLHGGNSVDAMSNNFKLEPIDAPWAKEKEILISNVIDENKYLSQMPHMAGECRSTQCKLLVLSDDQFYLDKLSNSLDKVIADHESSFSSYSTSIDEKLHTTNIYFNRN